MLSPCYGRGFCCALALGVEVLFSGFQLAELPGCFHTQLTGGAMGEQAQAPAIHHLVDDLDIDRGIGFIRVHAKNLMALASRKLAFALNLFSGFERLIPS